MKWTKENALNEIKTLIKNIDELHDENVRFSAAHTRWIASTQAFLEEVFGANSMYYQTFISFTWDFRGTLITGGPMDPVGSRNPQMVIQLKHQEAYNQQLETAKGLLQAAGDNLLRSDIDFVYNGKNTARESSDLLKILNLAENKLRKVIRLKPVKEKEIQDAFENLLIGAEVDFLREKENIVYSSKTYIPDFTCERIDLAIEIKFCDKKEREKELIAEINDDILAYKTKYGNLIFVVYDVGIIRDIEAFKSIFESNQNVIVRVIKH